MSIASTMALALPKEAGGHGSILVLGSDDDDNQSRDAAFCLDERFGTCAFGAASNSLRPTIRNKRKSFTLDEKSTTGSRQSIYGKSGDIIQRTASTPSLPLRRSDNSPPSTPYYSHSLHSTPTNSAPGTPVQTPTDALSCPLLTPTLLSTPSDLNLPKSRLSSSSLSSLSDASSKTTTTTITTTTTKQRVGGIIGTIRQQIAYQNLQADLSTSSPILLSAFEPWEKALLHSLLALSLTLLLYAAFAPDQDDGSDFMSKFNTAHF